MGTFGSYSDRVQSTAHLFVNRTPGLETAPNFLVTNTIVDGTFDFAEAAHANFDPDSWLLSYETENGETTIPVSLVAMKVFDREFPGQLNGDNVVNIVEAIRQFRQIMTGQVNG